MKPSLSLLLTVALAMGLGSCGRMGQLEHTKDMKPVPVAAGTSRAATADELMAPSPQSRPLRNGDLLYRSEKRPEDPFDKPPGATNGR